jgi:hypothetical protein
VAILPELGDKLSSQSVASSSGAGDFFLTYGEMPDSTAVASDRMVALLQTQGFAPDAATEVDRPAVQLLVRGQSRTDASTAYEEAEAKAQEAKRVLHGITPGDIGGRHYVGIWAEQDPFFGGYDERRRPVFVTNYRIERSRT